MFWIQEHSNTLDPTSNNLHEFTERSRTEPTPLPYRPGQDDDEVLQPFTPDPTSRQMEEDHIIIVN